MEPDTKYDLIDARTDQRWVLNVNSLVEREDWNELWKLAQRTPPIWTVRILKHLNKRSWFPDAEENLSFFQELSKFVAACNEYDLPGPEIRNPITMQLDAMSSPLAAARITVDGEFVFFLDGKASTIEVRRLSDLGFVERIRLDMIGGKQYATLAFAVSESGDQLAVLSYEPNTKTASIRLSQIRDGEVVADHWLPFKHADLGLQIPRMAFDANSRNLAIQHNLWSVAVVDLEKGIEVQNFSNTPRIFDREFVQVSTARSDSHASEWFRFGQRSVSDLKSPGLFIAKDGEVIVAACCDHLAISGAGKSYISSSTGIFAVAKDGKMVATLDNDSIVLTDANDAFEVVALCRDPAARIAISEDSGLVAVAMPHFEFVKLWHLPDGRALGSLPGLAREALVEFKFSSGGSIIAVTKSGKVQVWEADGNGNAWAWSKELVQITHQPVDRSSVEVLRQAQEMRRRGWLSIQESNLLDLALALMQQRLNLDIEIEWDSELPGDVFDIEIE